MFTRQHYEERDVCHYRHRVSIQAISCLGNGDWRPAEYSITCTPMTCSVPFDIANAQVSLSICLFVCLFVVVFLYFHILLQLIILRFSFRFVLHSGSSAAYSKAHTQIQPRASESSLQCGRICIYSLGCWLTLKLFSVKVLSVVCIWEEFKKY